MTVQVLYQGAEAVITRERYLGFEVVCKRRVSKGYRIEALDRRLIASRTREEAKLLTLARKSGVSVPVVFDVNLAEGVLILEFLAGRRVKDLLDTVSEQIRKQVCEKIGECVARLHNHDIVHGDITTSNMILVDDRVHLIDFGLGGVSDELEAKGVDLHVLMEAFESTHSAHPQCFGYVWGRYAQVYQGDAGLVKDKIDAIIRRGRYR